jgi:hypothetical protein
MIAFELLVADNTALPATLSCELAEPAPANKTETRIINSGQVVCHTSAGRLIGATSTSLSDDKLTLVEAAIIVALLVAVKQCRSTFFASSTNLAKLRAASSSLYTSAYRRL